MRRKCATSWRWKKRDRYRVAEQVAREGARRELVDQAAGRDDEDRRQQRDLARPDAKRAGAGLRSWNGRHGSDRVQWIAAATMSPMAIAMAPTTIASAVFFFSTISDHRS